MLQKDFWTAKINIGVPSFQKDFFWPPPKKYLDCKKNIYIFDPLPQKNYIDPLKKKMDRQKKRKEKINLTPQKMLEP